MSQLPIDAKKEGIPQGLWMRCPECEEMLYRKVVEEALNVCPNCDHHFRIAARTRIEQLADPGSFEEMFGDIEPTDPLKFVDKRPYKDRLKAEQAKSGQTDAAVCGKAFIKGREIMLGVMDPTFMMGSMGSVVGERLTRTIETAAAEKLPVSSSPAPAERECRKARSASCRWPKPARRLRNSTTPAACSSPSWPTPPPAA